MTLNRSDMSLHERLVVLMGEIQYADVLVEDELRVVLLALNPTAQLPRLYGDLVRRTGEALRDHTSVDGNLKALGADLLVELNQAHGERNRLLHDRWVPDRNELGTWRSGVQARRLAQTRNQSPRDLLAKVSTTTLKEFEECLVALRRMRWRVEAFEYLIEPGPDGDADEIDTQRDIVEDHFTMSRDGMSITYLG